MIESDLINLMGAADDDELMTTLKSLNIRISHSSRFLIMSDSVSLASSCCNVCESFLCQFFAHVLSLFISFLLLKTEINRK